MAKDRKKITPKKTIQPKPNVMTSRMSPDAQEKALQSLHTDDKKKKVQRVTVDFPLEIYDDMKKLTEDSGHTLKWFIVNLVKKHLANKKTQD